MSGKQTIKWVQLSFALIILAFVVSGLWAACQGQNSGFSSSGNAVTPGFVGRGLGAPSAQLIIPDKIGAMRLVNAQRGQEAVAQISKLHGTDVGVQAGYIASYAGSGNRATLWVAQTASTPGAKRLVDLMTDKIRAGPSSGRTTFTGLQELEKEGRVVYTVTGGGEKHYYYQASAKVVWLAVGGEDPDDIFQRVFLSIG